MKDKNIKKQLVDSLDLPKEILLSYPLVSMIGQEEILIQNHKGLIEYTGDIIRIKTKIGTLKIQGSHLYINKMSTEDLKITGIIKKIEFME